MPTAKNVFKLKIVIFLVFIITGLNTKAQMDTFSVGGIINPVKCMADETQSYALFLPSNYSTKRDWPIIIVLEPVARGVVGTKVFEKAAEEFGYIVATSNNSRNGLYENNFKAFEAVWEDVQNRFKIDNQRVYLSGFSGGARAAWAIAIKYQNITGIIGCGAALPSMYQGRPIQKDKLVFVGLVGDADMNYLEMHDLKQYLDKKEIENTLYVFNAGHQWPPPNVITAALEWLELNSMKSQIVPSSAPFIQALEKKQLQKVDTLIKAEDWVQAMAILKSTKNDFQVFKQPSYLNHEIENLSTTKEYKTALKKWQNTKLEEEQYQTQYIKAAGELLLPTQDIDSLMNWWDSEIISLKRKAKSKHKLKQKLAARLLNLIAAMSFQSSQNKIEALDYVAARLLIKLSIKVSPNNYWYLYNLAKIECLDTDYKEAYKTLEKAIALGIPSKKWLSHPAFDSIRNEDKFEQLLKLLD